LWRCVSQSQESKSRRARKCESADLYVCSASHHNMMERWDVRYLPICQNQKKPRVSARSLRCRQWRPRANHALHRLDTKSMVNRGSLKNVSVGSCKVVEGCQSRSSIKVKYQGQVSRSSIKVKYQGQVSRSRIKVKSQSQDK
jgi:hypothetical protein